jgi:hypothetical protein
MPTYGRPKIALKQAKTVFKQIQEHRKTLTKIDVKFLISINCDDSYSSSEFEKYSDLLIYQPVNLGANINIAFGFFQAKQDHYNFLWIIGDDEPIPIDAVYKIYQSITESNFDFLIGSLRRQGNLDSVTSYQKLSQIVGGTPSFISSTIYNCQLILEKDIESALDLHFTNFPHLVIINRVIERNKSVKIICLPLLSICRVDQRPNTVPARKVPRNSFGYRDSMVFFGKPLAILGVVTKKYRKKELSCWWKENWHRVNMFKDKRDFRYNLLVAISLNFYSLLPLVILGKIPFWKLKNFIKPTQK